MKRFIVNEDVLRAIASYIASKPWAEADPYMRAIDHAMRTGEVKSEPVAPPTEAAEEAAGVSETGEA